MNDAHVGHTATLLSSDLIADFTVLVAGGVNSLGFISSEAELYKSPPPVVLPMRRFPMEALGFKLVR